MAKKIIEKAGAYFAQSQNVKKMGTQFEKILSGLGGARKNLQKNQPSNILLKTLKIGGVFGLALLQALTKALKIGMVDNLALRAAEIKFAKIKPGKNKKGNDKKFSTFLRKHPAISSYLLYYMIALGVLFGTSVGNIRENNIEEKDFFSKEGKKFDPGSQDFINLCKACENLTCIPIIYTETRQVVPKIQDLENVWTHGWGMTWSFDSGGHMTIRDYADTPANRKKGFKPHKPKESRTKDEDLEETQQFLIDHIYSKIQKNMTREFTENELYGLCVAGYQLPGHLPAICKQLSAAKTRQEAADAFITPNMYKYGGTPKRRWICGMLAAEYITIQDVVNAHVDAFYGPDINTFIRDGKFVCNASTIKYVLGLKRKETTRSVLEQLADGRLALASVMKEKKTKTLDFSPPSKDDAQIAASMEFLIRADNEYINKKYINAAELYKKAVDSDPDNMEAYSSLALAYKKLGDENKSINYYKMSLGAVVACNARMNANRNLLMDHAVKGSSYYNAGLAREAMAEIYKKKGEIIEAENNYILALKNYKTALYNYEQLDGFETNKEIYKKSIEKMKQVLGLFKRAKQQNGTKGSKKLGFNSGDLNVNSKLSDIGKLEIYKTVKSSDGRA
ncbi:MAG: tetratricopeptide repeat protein [Rickettsiales bacterium]|jgi:hypothetical protein|nr:tetratricopeptide repeat protein [Rickettsiales bacterium]